MKELSTTYGKTFHTWQIDKGHTLPLGPPKCFSYSISSCLLQFRLMLNSHPLRSVLRLMLAFTADGQVNPAILKERDRLTGVRTEEKRKNRLDIAYQAPSKCNGFWLCGFSRVDYALDSI
jgi:hypothetical protein